MSQTIAILGRQPALGIAELESLYGADALRPVGTQAVLIAKDPSEIDFARLGGTVKIAKLLSRPETTDWAKLVRNTAQALPEHLEYIPEGKIRLGLNTYGFRLRPTDLNRSGLELKKVVKQAGRSVRVVPNTNLDLNSAQTLHNQLTGPTGLELVYIKDGKHTLFGQVVAVQDINAYAARDQKRPKRDSRVGMLPPKLAQTIVNLAASQTIPSLKTTVLDPFCGTGVVLQEAMLMGYKVAGSDLEPRMIEYTNVNLDWLTTSSSHLTHEYIRELSVGDATSTHWGGIFDIIAGETYLGRPFSAEPDSKTLQQVMQDVDTIHRKFLRNVAAQTKAGFRMCIAVPAWHTRAGVKHLKMLDSLEDLGYTRMSFVHANNRDLVYHRENQVVGRELVVLTRK